MYDVKMRLLSLSYDSKGAVFNVFIAIIRVGIPRFIW